MAEIYIAGVHPNIDIPKDATHLNIALRCIGSAERDCKLDTRIKRFLNSQCILPLEVVGRQIPAAKHLHLATESLAMPEENPALQVILKAIANVYDTEARVMDLTVQLAEEQAKIPALERTLSGEFLSWEQVPRLRDM